MRGVLSSVLTLSLCCCSVVEATLIETTDAPVVETSYGKVKGKYTEESQVFKSIPFGGSVSGANRWKEAKHPEPWTGILDGTNDPPACPQADVKAVDYKEDCLFLNVFAPLGANPSSNLPVLVFIHGGAYVAGYSASSTFDGSYLANHSNIVVVTTNYRLGALGFMVYGRGQDAVKGNFGIKDQQLALRWVQRNIPSFGGNPNQVTISGESAGAMSVAIHMTSKNSTGLFHQAIIESDPFGIDYVPLEKQRRRCEVFATLFLCSDINCMREKSVSEILKVQKDLVDLPGVLFGDIWANLLYWAPVIDGIELTDQPLALFEKGNFSKIPVIMGTTSDEGAGFVYGVITVPIIDIIYPPVLSLMFGALNRKKAKSLYPPLNGTNDQRPEITKAMTDYAFYCPTILSAKSALHFASNVPVYSYIFDQPAPEGVDNRTECKTNACHTAELSYVFHTAELVGGHYTPEERELADAVSEYWGNFVSTGNPNTPGHGAKGFCEADGECRELVHWPQFTAADDSLVMKTPIPQVHNNYRKRYCDVVNTFGYGQDVLAALRHAAETVQAIAVLQG